jgi:hypothetical protein
MNHWAPILDAAKAARSDFKRACENPLETQERLLRRLLAANAQTEFGRRHDFSGIKTVEDFRSRVPVRTYEQMKPWIERATAGIDGVLTSDRPIAIEETGGSGGGCKMILRTAAGLRSFRNGILPWLGDLAERRPAAFGGALYVAMSPVARQKRWSAAGIPIGSLGDAAYLGHDLQAPFIDVLAVPPSVGELTDIAAWRFLTLLHLLRSADLTFISVFSPTFLIGLIEALPGLAEGLIAAIHDGGADTPRDPARARLVARALARSVFAAEEVWSRLSAISAWADGASAVYADRLRGIFANVDLQPKGLMATEAVVSLPWGEAPGAAPALTSTFLEFIGDDGCSRLCHELRDGDEYGVVITTSDGLYRYDLGDRVRCVDSVGDMPRLAFVGRGGATSDLVGEKLAEPFVASVLLRIGRPACLIAMPSPRPCYELLVEASSESFAAAIAHTVDQNLNVNPQYAYARALGQLGAVRGRAVSDLVTAFNRACTEAGMRLGDVKPPTLVANPIIATALLAPNSNDAASIPGAAFAQTGFGASALLEAT